MTFFFFLLPPPTTFLIVGLRQEELRLVRTSPVLKMDSGSPGGLPVAGVSWFTRRHRLPFPLLSCPPALPPKHGLLGAAVGWRERPLCGCSEDPESCPEALEKFGGSSVFLPWHRQRGEENTAAIVRGLFVRFCCTRNLSGGADK